MTCANVNRIGNEASAEQRATLRGRQLRIRITEHGRQVVNLRIPIGFVDAALGIVPGIGGEQSERRRLTPCFTAKTID